jgi:hypothetical protein
MLAPRGYQPIPCKDHVDDTAADLQWEHDPVDEELDYIANDPLLSEGNGRDVSAHDSTSKGFTWSFKRPSWAQHSYPLSKRVDLWSWSPRSEYSKPGFFTKWLILFLISTVLALGTIVGILSARLWRQPDLPTSYKYDITNIPHYNDNVRSWNYQLNFPSTYPPLKASASKRCQLVWNSLPPLFCHEKIWNR